MAITAFDTHKFVRRLEQAGMPTELAEVQADLLTEAFTVNLESLVSQDFLDTRLIARFAEQNARIDTRFAEQDARIDARFAEQDARIDTRFAEQDARIDTRFAEQNARIDARFAEQDARIDTRFAELEAKVDSNHKLVIWTQAIIMAAVILPYLERLMAL
ncbi:MAG: hypothetical protein R3F50_08230 [Gammaproteobacteria bacterium]|jgi:hypothetical protein